MQLPLSWPSLHLSEQYCLRGELPFFPRVPHRSGALEARGRGVTLGPSPGERKRERERESKQEGKGGNPLAHSPVERKQAREHEERRRRARRGSGGRRPDPRGRPPQRRGSQGRRGGARARLSAWGLFLGRMSSLFVSPRLVWRCRSA